VILNSFIYSGYLYSASSSPLLLRGALDTARILCRSFMPKLVQGLYVAASSGFETHDPSDGRRRICQCTTMPTSNFNINSS